MTTKEIAEIIKKKADSVSVTLSRSDSFVPLGDGKWGLKSFEEETSAFS